MLSCSVARLSAASMFSKMPTSKVPTTATSQGQIGKGFTDWATQMQGSQGIAQPVNANFGLKNMPSQNYLFQ